VFHRSLLRISRSPTLSLLITVLVLSSLLPAAISDGVLSSSFPERRQTEAFSPDYWPTNGWLNATPEDHGMNSEKLQEIIDHVTDENLPIEFVLIIKDGYIVFEHYFGSYFGPDKKEPLWSGTRGITGVTFGIALDKGLISNLTHPVIDFFPDYDIANVTPWKESITIEDLVTMTSGFEWDEITIPYDRPGNYFTDMIASGNWAEFVLNLPVTHEPGSQWNFCGGDSHLLSCIFTRVTGMSLRDFASDNLFGPLNITDVSWSQESYGITNGAGGLRMTPRDLAKFGYLMLNNGTWDSTQVISQEWVRNATSPKNPVTEELGYGYETYYGYHWWIHTGRGVTFMHRLPEARNVYLIPEHNTVVVMSAGLVEEPYPQGDLLYNYILSSLDTTPTTTGGELALVAVVAGAIVVAVVLFAWYKRTKAG